MSYVKAIQKMIDEGNDILQVAKLFGGIDKLLKIAINSPYLETLINTKLGGDLHWSAEYEDGDMIPFSLHFIINELVEEDDGENYLHYSCSVNVIIPEIKDSPALMQMLLTWLDDYLSDMGAEVGQFNDGKLNQKMIWVGVDKINGRSFKNSIGEVSDEEVLRIIPNEYKNP
jgi:hypothetical protein